MGYSEQDIRKHEKNVLLAEYMGYTRKTNEEIYAEDGWLPHKMEEYFNLMPHIRTQVNFKVGWDWYNPAGLRFDRSWDWLAPVVAKINQDTGYAVTVGPRRASIRHDDVYFRKVYGNKILKYYFDSCNYDCGESCIENVWEMVVKFVELNRDHREPYNGNKEGNI